MYNIVLLSFILNYFYTEKESHVFSANKYELFATETSVLKCEGSVDIPEFSTIYIEKENVTLKDSSSNHVELFVSNKNIANPFGVYYCVLNASGVLFNESLYLKDKGTL